MVNNRMILFNTSNLFQLVIAGWSRYKSFKESTSLNIYLPVCDNSIYLIFIHTLAENDINKSGKESISEIMR